MVIGIGDVLLKDHACVDRSIVNRRGASMSGEKIVVIALEQRMFLPGLVFVDRTKACAYGEMTVFIGTEDSFLG